MTVIIDTHVHLGDILWPGGAGVILKQGPARPRGLNLVRLSELTGHSVPAVERFAIRHFMDQIIASLLLRSASATMENLARDMAENRITAAVLLPVPPNVRYEDLARFRDRGTNILPFTGIRTDLGADAPAALRRDAADGARGLKLHAILQKLPYTDPLTYAVLEEARSLDLPVLFHAGWWSYYLGDDKGREMPGLGAASFARKMVADFPDVRFITGHSGLMDIEAFRQALAGFKNVWMETSFASPAAIREIVAQYGPDRVLYGSDWPFGSVGTSVGAVRSACGRDRALAERIFAGNALELLGI